MDWRSGFETVKGAAKAAHEKGRGLAGDAIEQHWPTIQQALREHVAPTTNALISDDELVERAAQTLHRFLPFPVRLVIRPQQLVSWFLSNRDRVLATIRPATSVDAIPPKP